LLASKITALSMALATIPSIFPPGISEIAAAVTLVSY
jgi:hypothetical protein